MFYITTHKCLIKYYIYILNSKNKHVNNLEFLKICYKQAI